MITKTLEDLIVEIESDLYQTAGIATQVYSQQLIVNKITDAVIMLANDPEKNWKNFDRYEQYTLDGVNGRTTVSVSTTFTQFNDIRTVFIGDTDRKLMSLPYGINPFRLDGDDPRYIAPDSLDTFRVFPTTATGTISVVGRSIPISYENGDIVPFDYIALKNFVCWKYMTDDGTNPAAAESFRQLYTLRYDALSKLQDQAPISLNGQGQFDYPRDWYVE